MCDSSWRTVMAATCGSVIVAPTSVGEALADRLVEPELAGLDELQHDDRRDHLADAGDPEAVARLDRLGGRRRGRSSSWTSMRAVEVDGGDGRRRAARSAAARGSRGRRCARSRRRRRRRRRRRSRRCRSGATRWPRRTPPIARARSSCCGAAVVAGRVGIGRRLRGDRTLGTADAVVGRRLVRAVRLLRRGIRRRHGRQRLERGRDARGAVLGRAGGERHHRQREHAAAPPAPSHATMMPGRSRRIRSSWRISPSLTPAGAAPA